MTRPLETDIRAREYRELAERALAERDGTMALEACAGWLELHRSGYRLLELSPDDDPKPVRMRARYDGLCTGCGRPVCIDDPIVYRPGVAGVQCAPCGGL